MAIAHLPEVLGILLVIVYIGCYQWGSTKNKLTVEQWYRQVEPVLKEQFAGAARLTTESADEYGLWVSGRRKCNWLYCLLRLRKRQDLYHYIRSLVFGSPDKLLVHVELTDAAPMVLCICQETMTRALTANYDDLKRYTERRPGTSYGLPAGLVVLSESAELAQKMVSKELASAIDHYSQFIDFIHVSDQYYPAASPDEQPYFKRGDAVAARRASFKFTLPEHDRSDVAVGLLRDVVIPVIDARVQLSVMAKSAADKLRVRANEERAALLENGQQR